MSKLFIASTSALVFVLGIAGAQANPGGQGAGPDFHGHHSQGYPAAGMGQSNMMGNGMMGSGMMGAGMMGAGMMGSGMMMNPGMMVVMMDANSDGFVSAEEFQALHARMFDYLDANGDGKIEAGELGATPDERSGDASE